MYKVEDWEVASGDTMLHLRYSTHTQLTDKNKILQRIKSTCGAETVDTLMIRLL